LSGKIIGTRVGETASQLGGKTSREARSTREILTGKARGL